jgi:hypothetical protein
MAIVVCCCRAGDLVPSVMRSVHSRFYRVGVCMALLDFGE